MGLIEQSLDCRLLLSQLLSTTRGGGIGTFLGCGNVVSPSNQPTVIVGIINKLKEFCDYIEDQSNQQCYIHCKDAATVLYWVTTVLYCQYSTLRG